MTDLKLAIAQFNPIVGDIAGNARRLLEWRQRAGDAHLLVGGELCLCGYPPEDLVLKPMFLDRVQAAAEALAEKTASPGPALLIGAPWRIAGAVYNCALLLEGGRIAGLTAKHRLPNYGVFDELRVFSAGPLPTPIVFRGVKLGVLVCEDIWHDGPAEHLAKEGAEALIVLNGSPFEKDKQGVREELARRRVNSTGLPLVYVNQIGGQDELVFDGASFALDSQGRIVSQLSGFREGLESIVIRRINDGMDISENKIEILPDGDAAIYQALVLGLRDYVRKNGFPGVILGLSGGIDSAISAAVAADALGPDKVWCVMMPSLYTAQESLDDAAECARLLGCRLDTASIGPAMTAYQQTLQPFFAGTAAGVTEENVQPRIRGQILMALSNKFGPMVLSTGNKSEMSVGYATLYGDMCGGYSVLKDVYKGTVYSLSHWRNRHFPEGGLGPKGRVIPERIITRAPTAELKPNQTDQDTLPPYPELDAVLECLIEKEMGTDEIVAQGFAPALVNRVWRMLDRAEYKRRQAPPGVKISARAFGRDRRYPITNAFSALLDE